MIRSLMGGVFILACAVTLRAQATGVEAPQNEQPKDFYQLTYVLRELDGDKLVNSRSYFANTRAVQREGNETHQFLSSIRAGEKVPFASSEGPNTTWQQVNVGVKIDSKNLRVLGDRVWLQISATIDSVAVKQESSTRQPVIRNNDWFGEVMIPLRKPTVIFSSDDPFSTHKIQLQLTVVPLS